MVLGIVIGIMLILVGIVAAVLTFGHHLGRTSLYRYFPHVSNWGMMSSPIFLLCFFFGLVFFFPPAEPDLITLYLLGSGFCCIAWLSFISAIDQGGRERQKVEQNSEQLKLWLERLVKDQAAKSNPLKIAYDLERLAELYEEAGNLAAAVQAYDQACPLIVRELGDHPYARDFLSAYAELLRKSARIDHAEQIELRLEAVGWEGDLS